MVGPITSVRNTSSHFKVYTYLYGIRIPCSRLGWDDSKWQIAISSDLIKVQLNSKIFIKEKLTVQTQCSVI